MTKKIADFQISKLIFEKGDRLIYEAFDDKQQKQIILKLLNSEYPTHEELSSFKSEYELLNSFNHQTIAKTVDFRKFNNTYLAVLEHVSGSSIKSYLKGLEFNLVTYLKTAISLSKALSEIHRNQKTLKEFNPETTYIDKKSNEVTFIDLTQATQSDDDYLSQNSLNSMLLGYISPELTGKVNRRVDRRSDIYSLGVLLYELATGVLPFQNQDPMEMIYRHVVEIPISPRQLNPSLPDFLSKIILKCLEKVPEDRYQSAKGIIYDLETCLTLVQRGKMIDNTFILGKLDIDETFKISERLYGRDQELALLEESFKRVCNGKTEWFLVSGYPGIGKTSLVKELNKSIVAKRGTVITGKFEQLQHHIPFSALSQAFKKLIQDLLKENEDVLEVIRSQLLAQLKNNGQVLIDVIPELEFIIGKQPPIIKLSGEENRNRFVRVINDFIQVFAVKDHPLVLFLDDLQWADSASLNCLKDLLMGNKVNYLFIISTYRSQEVSSTHALTVVLNEIEKANGRTSLINLTPLKVEDIEPIISDTFHCSAEEAIPFAEVVFNKTGGNPFFINQLLKKLYEEDYVKFDDVKRAWSWNIESLKNLEMTENVLDLMQDKINQFSDETKEYLSIGAGIGPRFFINSISKISHQSVKNILRGLNPAIKFELIKPEQSSSYINELIREDSPETWDEESKILENMNLSYRFVHDKIHQSCDNIGTSEEKLKQHYKIGQLFLKERESNLNDEALLFEVVTQLNFAREIITSAEMRKTLAALNLEACLKAKNSAAYALAYEHAIIARSLLPQNSWQNEYELTYAIFLECTECGFFQKKFDEIEILSSEILENAKTKIDKGKLYVVKMGYYTVASDYEKVIEVGLSCAKLFNVNIPLNPSVPSILWSIFKLKRMMGKRTVQDLENLPQISDEETAFLVRLLVMLFPPTFLLNKKLMVYVNVLSMIMTIQHGNCEFSPYAYGGYGIILQTLFKDFKTSYDYSILSINLAEKSGNHTVCCRAYFLMALLVNHWTHPIKKTSEFLNKCYLHGLDSGELFYLSYITAFYGFADGTYFTNIKEADKLLQSYSDVLYSAKNAQAILSHKLRTQLLAQLSNPKFRGSTLTDEHFDEEDFYRQIKENTSFKPVLQGYATFKSMLNTYFGLYQEGIDLYEESKGSRESIHNFMTERDLLFFYGLNLVGVSTSLTGLPLFKNIRQIKKIIKTIKLWVKNCPENNLHRYCLLRAELARLQGKEVQAHALYDESTKHALDNDFFGEAGLAYEMAAKYYIQLEKLPLAKSYMREAHYTYYRWGALSKTAQLEELYPHLIEGNKTPALIDNDQNQDKFGISVILKASRVLSKEISLGKLLNEVLRFLIVEAGADRALFIMNEEGELLIQGEKKANQEGTKLLQALNLEDHSDEVSFPVINYVLRTQEKVIINDWANEEAFKSDAYFNRAGVKAALCMPVIHQGNLVAILYLENSAAKDVFSADKIHILEMLSAQIATSIENSTLYGKLEAYNRNLETKVLERTEELQQKNSELAVTLDELQTTQNHLIESEKLAALGQLIAGIAHEVNTPLGAVKASSQNILLDLDLNHELLNHLFDLDDGKTSKFFANLLSRQKNSSEIKTFSSREDRKQRQLLAENLKAKNIENAYEIADILFEMRILEDVSEEIAAYGNRALPLLNFIYSYSKISNNTKNILMAVERSSKIIFALKSYIHESSTSEMTPSDIVEGLESVLVLYQYQLRDHVILEKNIAKVPPVLARVNEINQVWTNLIHNSLQAMDGKGKLEIAVFPEEDNLVVQITDSGRGIPDDIKSRMFVPFFTTKAKGEGSGLGLTISKKIIEAHHGSLNFESQPGHTTFTVKLPLKNTVTI